MLPFILGFVGVAVLNGIAVSSAKNRQQLALAVAKKKMVFQSRGDHRRIRSDAIAHHEQTLRGYQPTYEPIPRKLVAGADDDGMEQFAFNVHPDLGELRIEIYKKEERPVDLISALRGLRAKRSPVARDPQYNVPMYRHLHYPTSRHEWFVICITARDLDEEWLFEHRSLYHERLSNRPRLAAPVVVSKAEQETIEREAKEYEERILHLYEDSQTRVTRLMADVERMRADLERFIKAQQQYDASPEGISQRLAGYGHIAKKCREQRAAIDADEKLTPEQREDLHAITEELEGLVMGQFRDKLKKDLIEASTVA